MPSAARVFDLMRSLPEAGLDALNWPVLILAPHPDDETLGCGGLIAAAVSERRAVFVLVLTDGAGSHPRSLDYPAARLRRLREAESRQAGHELGLPADRISHLGLPDTRAPQRGVAATRAADAISDHAVACGARTLLTTWRHDPHSDHLAASILAARAASACGAELLEYPVWGWTLPPRRLLRCRPPAGFRLDVSAHLGAKRRAIACHRSQLGQVITDDPDGFVMEQRFVDFFTGPFETFLRPPAVEPAISRV